MAPVILDARRKPMPVSYRREDAIGTISLDHPPANSYDTRFLEALDSTISAAADDGGARVIVVRSTVDRFFSGGADLHALSAATPEGNLEMCRLAHRILGRIAQIPKIFIAQIHGHALGGGLEIALACDLRFGAAGDYQIGLPEVTLGLLPGHGGSQRLPRLIGWSKALDLMVTGRRISPGEAFQLGILDRLFPRDQLEAQTQQYGRALAAGASAAIGAIKLAVHGGQSRSLEEALRYELEWVATLYRSPDSREGIRAFVEKRRPQFL